MEGKQNSVSIYVIPLLVNVKSCSFYVMAENISWKEFKCKNKHAWRNIKKKKIKFAYEEMCQGS